MMAFFLFFFFTMSKTRIHANVQRVGVKCKSKPKQNPPIINRTQGHKQNKRNISKFPKFMGRWQFKSTVKMHAVEYGF